MPSSRKSTCCGSYGQIDKAVFHWFVGKRSLKVPTDGATLTEKGLEFVKTLGVKEFKSSDCSLNKWMKRYKYNNSFLFCLILHYIEYSYKEFPKNDDPFKSLREDLEKLHELDNDAIGPNLSAESFADLVSEVVTSASFSINDDIIAEVIKRENEETEDDQDDEESTPPTFPSTNGVEDALGTLQDLSMFSTHGDKVCFLAPNMGSLLDRERIDKLKQSNF